MKTILKILLKILSKIILKKYKPEIIGITGSVGKTTAKNAITLVLQEKYTVLSSPKNYNTEIGVPLTIIGAMNPTYSVFGWIKVFIKACHLIIFRHKNYPHILILEMAADHPGDIKYLTSFTRPKVGVITSVGATHLEFFNTIENVAREKISMISSLPRSAYAVINQDQEILSAMSYETQAKLVTFGLKKADIIAKDIVINKDKGGLDFKLVYNNKFEKIYIPNLLGRPAIYSLLAAVSVGVIYNLDLSQIKNSLRSYTTPPGRLNLLPGIKYTTLIDDSYNSSPLAVSAALEVLSHLNCAQSKFAVLGDMLELGQSTLQAHRDVGIEVTRLGIDYLVTVGPSSKETANQAIKYGMSTDNVFSFDDSTQAGKFLQDKIEEGDLILIKGSAGVRMEYIVKEIMAEPDRAKELLVRQD